MKNVKRIISILLVVSMLVCSNLTVFASESLNYYYVEKEMQTESRIQANGRIQTKTIWDFIDIAMAGASWYDVIKDPSLKNVGWAILDTAAIAPLVPSSKWVREGSKYTIPISELKKLASTPSGKNKLLKSLKVTKATSKLNEAAELAKNYKLTEGTYQYHIVKDHGYNSIKQNKSKFYKTFDIKKGIKDTLLGDSKISDNTDGRAGYIFKKTYSQPIGVSSNGKTPFKVLKVVLSRDGYVITAYPVNK